MTRPLVYVDCETTGLDPDRHEIWEIVESFAAGVLNLDHVPSLSEICERLDIAPGDHTAAGDVRAVRDAHQTLRTLRGGLGPLL